MKEEIVGYRLSEDTFICADCCYDIPDAGGTAIHKQDRISFDCSQCGFYWNSVRREFE